jgi:hypothetical protein
MAHTVFSNEDLKRHIFSFGYPEHREFVHSLKETLQVDCDRFQNMFMNHSGDGCMSQYLLEEFTEAEMIEWMDYFNRCKCCTRHSHYKPFICAKGANVPDRHTTVDYYYSDCSCACRHLARHCARTIYTLSRM